MKKRAFLTVPISVLLIAVVVTSIVLINIKPKTDNIPQAQKLSEYSKPAVVRVIDYSIVQWKFNGYDSEVDSYLQKTDYQTVVGGLGSGAVISSDGYIVTNAHVVEPTKMEEKDIVNEAFKQMVSDYANTYGYDYNTLFDYMSYLTSYTGVKNVLKVIMPGGDSYDGEIKSYGAPINEGKDVAVLKIEAKNLPTIPLGNSDSIQNQDNVWVIGYPAAADVDILSPESALVSSMNEGQISATSKTTESGSPVIQLNAAATHGNSGGPVINDKGQIIGLLTGSGTVNGQEVQGFNFAVPVNTVKEFVNQAGVRNMKSETNTLFQEGLTYYWGGYYKNALNKFEAVQRIYPKQSEVANYITESEKKADQSKILWSDYKTAFYIIDGISGLLIILLMVYTFAIKPKQPDAPVASGDNTDSDKGEDGVIPFRHPTRKSG